MVHAGIIDLTGDSDDDMAFEREGSSSADVIIKNEPVEKKTQVPDSEPTTDQPDVSVSIAQSNTNDDFEPEETALGASSPLAENHASTAGAAQASNGLTISGAVQHEDLQDKIGSAPIHVEDQQQPETASDDLQPSRADISSEVDAAATTNLPASGELGEPVGDTVNAPEEATRANQDSLEATTVPEVQPELEQNDVNFANFTQDARGGDPYDFQDDSLFVQSGPLANNELTTDSFDDADATNFEFGEFDTFGDVNLDLGDLNALADFNENREELDGTQPNETAFTGDAQHYHDMQLNFDEASQELLGTVVDDNRDVMDWNSLLVEDAAANQQILAGAFAKRKEEYEQKKRIGTNTQADDIRFAAEEAEEETRLRNLARSQMEVEEPPTQSQVPPATDEDDLLFVPEVPELPQPKKRATPRQKNKLSKKDLDESIAAGMQAGFGEGRKPKRKARATSQERPTKKQRRATTADGAKKSTQKRGRKQRPRLSNIASLGRTNIVEAAQANASKPDMPTFTAGNKAKAVQELVASIPSSERGNVSSERAAILEATKKFKGKGAMKSDCHGGWLLKGMESSLYNHQLLGTAFLRERETGKAKPNGGLVCDEMGFGKTIQMIANMIDGKAEPHSAIKTTLIVAPPTLLNQWMQEMEKHVKGNSLGRILRYHSGSRLQSNNVLADLQAFDVILTTYGEVQKSYPACDPPKHLVSDQKKNEWWQAYYHDKVGPLHRIKFHRIVLDEAHAIKNHLSKTSVAVRALAGNYKWCITGTPIQNYVEELFPYFSFLKVPHTGDYATFLHNYCNNRTRRGEAIPMGRLHNILRAIMLRRTHVDTLFNAPIVKLAGITHNTVHVDFNPVERNIYNMVKARYVQQINTYSKSGSLVSNYSNVLGMLLRLRMLCGHIMIIQDVLKQMFNAADIESLWRLTAKEMQTSDDPGQMNLIKTLRQTLINKKNHMYTTQTKEMGPTPAMTPDIIETNNMDTGSTYGLYFKFRKFLRSLSQSDTWAELHIRSACAKCRAAPPDDPVCTSCFHVYCHECICQLHNEARERGEEKAACLQCQTLFEETTPCNGLKELGFGGPDVMPVVEKKKKRLDRQKDRIKKAARGKRGTSDRRSIGSDAEDDEEEPYIDWIAEGGAMLPSAKLTATKAAILNWRESHPHSKIIVYTQFLDLGRIFGKVCEGEGWGYTPFSGKMTIDARERAIATFRDDPDVFIMICSLRAGGVGLNLTMASKVIILDLWFNSSVEAQAYCRAFRIGQEQRVDVLRFVVRDSIDEDLIKMQDLKDVEVQGAIGSESMKKRATIAQLLELFGEVKEDDENEFILVEDDNQDEDDEEVDMADRLPPRPF